MLHPGSEVVDSLLEATSVAVQVLARDTQEGTAVEVGMDIVELEASQEDADRQWGPAEGMDAVLPRKGAVRNAAGAANKAGSPGSAEEAAGTSTQEPSVVGGVPPER